MRKSCSLETPTLTSDSSSAETTPLTERKSIRNFCTHSEKTAESLRKLENCTENDGKIGIVPRNSAKSDCPEWCEISFQRQRSFRQSQKAFGQLIQEKADERLKMQERTFRRWVNVQLEKSGISSMTDLFNDFREGYNLLALLEVLADTQLPRDKGKFRVHAINNVGTGLKFLQENEMQMANISASDIVDGNAKVTLALIWQIVQFHWKIYSEKTSDDLKDLKLQDALKRWCIVATKDWENVRMTDFTSCWKDGLAFCAILRHYRPALVDLQAVESALTEERLHLAFGAFREHFQVPQLLEVDDLNSDQIDSKSTMTYLLLLYESMSKASPPQSTAESPAAEVAAVKGDSPPTMKTSSDSSTKRRLSTADSDDVDLSSGSLPRKSSKQRRKLSVAEAVKDYQSCLEDVLTWLLDAEEKLTNMLPVCEEDLDLVKKQFKEHEEYMLSLTRSQDAVGRALQKGQILVHSGKLGDEETAELQKQVALVNTRWEQLRVGAMERQTKLQDRLTTLQQTQLDAVRQWLSDMEYLITESEPLSADSLKSTQQAEEHQEIQARLERQQHTIYRLSSFVAVVDEGQQGDQSYDQLEKTLQAIGKRWMTICVWAERRGQRLGGLAELLASLYTDRSSLADWLDVREAALASLRSAHHLASADEVAEQVRNLQTLETDLEREHPRLVRLSQTSGEAASRLDPDNTSAAVDVRRRFELIGQRWENLLARLDEHTQTLIRSGKADRTQFHGQSQPAVAESSTTVAVASSEPQTPISPSEMSAKIKRFCVWLDDAEALVSVSTEGMDPIEPLRGFEEAQKEFNNRQPDFENLHAAAQNLIGQNLPNVNPEEILMDLQGLNARWREIQLSLANRLNEARIEVQLESSQRDLKDVDGNISDLLKWSKTFDPENLQDLTTVRLTLKNCHEKLELIKQQEPKVQNLQKNIQELSAIAETLPKHSATPPKVERLKQDFDGFTSKWGAAVERLNKTFVALTKSFDQTPGDEEAKAEELLEEFMAAVDQVLATENLAKIDHVELMQAKIDRLRSLEKRRQSHELDLEDLLAEKPDSQAEELKNRWSTITSEIGEILQKLDTGVHRLKIWLETAEEMDKWLEKVTSFIHTEQPVHGDVAALNVQLEESQGLLTDMEMLYPKLTQLEAGARDLTSEATEGCSQQLHQRMDDIDRRWSDMERVARARHDGLNDALTQSKKVFTEIEDLSQFLASADAELTATVVITSGKELQDQIKRFKQLNDQLLERSDTVECAIGLGERLADSAHEAPVDELRKQLASTRQQWDNICIHVEQKLQRYGGAFEQWKEFQELLASEKIALDELERKLGEKHAVAADVEEYSEQIDLLDGLVETSGRMERIEELSRSLIGQNLLVDAVQLELDKLRTLRQKLMPAAGARRESLQRGLDASQQFEEQLFNCQSWISHVDYILHCRSEADISASEVPDEFKQLQREFDEHDACLRELAEFVDKSRQEGGGEAVERFATQLNHVTKMFTDLNVKYSEFKRPAQFERRLERASRSLTNLANEVKQLQEPGAVSSAADAQENVDRCQEVQFEVKEVAEEVAAVVFAGQKLAAEGYVEGDGQISSKISQLTKQQQRLVVDVTDSDSKLKRAREIVEKLEAEQRSVERLLDDTQSSLTIWSSAQPSNLPDEEQQFVESLRRDLNRREADLKMMDDRLDELRSLTGNDSVQILAAKSNFLRSQWNFVSDKLKQWQESMDDMRKDSESLLLDFEALSAAVSIDLDRSKLSKVDRFDKFDIDSLQGFQMDSQSLETRVGKLREMSAELGRRGLQSRAAELFAPVETKFAVLRLKFEELNRATSDLSRRNRETSESDTEWATPPPGRGVSLTSSRETTPSVGAGVKEATVSEEEGGWATPQLVLADDAATAADSHQLVERVAAATSGVAQASALLAFDRAPPTSVHEWQRRVDEAQFSFDAVEPVINDLLGRGKELANVGPMELHVQETLESMDQLHATADTFREKLEAEQENISQVLPTYDAVVADAKIQLCRLNKLETTVQKYPDQATLVKQELDSETAAFESLRQKSEEIRQKFPGKMATDGETNFERVQQTRQRLQNAIGVRERESALGAAADEAANVETQDAANGVRRFLQAADDTTEPMQTVAEIHSPPDSQHKEQQQLHECPSSEPAAAATIVQSEDSKQPQLEEESANTVEGPARSARVGLAAQSAALASVACAVETVRGVAQLEASLKTVEQRLRDGQQTMGEAAGYANFSEQEDALAAVNENLLAAGDVLSDLRQKVERLGDEQSTESDRKRLNLLLASVQLRLVKLREMHADRRREYEQRLELWQRFQMDVHTISEYVKETEKNLAELRLQNGSLDVETMEQSQREMERTRDESSSLFEAVAWEAQNILSAVSGAEATLVKEKVDMLARRWQLLGSEIADRRERLEERQAEDSELREEVDELLFWCDETETFLLSNADPSNRVGLRDLLRRCLEFYEELPDRQRRLKVAELAKEKYIAMKLVPDSAKQQMRRDIAELQSRTIKIKRQLEARKTRLEMRLERCASFWEQLEKLANWTQQTRQLLDEFNSATIYTPTRLDPQELDADIRTRQPLVDELRATYDSMRGEAWTETDAGELSIETMRFVEQFLTDWSTVVGLAAVLRTSSSSVSPPSSDDREQQQHQERIRFADEDESPQMPTESQQKQKTAAGYTSIVKKRVVQTETQAQQTNGHRAAELTAPTLEDIGLETNSDGGGGEYESVAVSRVMQRLSPRSAELMRQLVQLKHWLADSTRDAAAIVDIVHLDAIKEAAREQQTLLDQLQTRRLELIRVLEDARNSEVQHKAELLSHEWERCVAAATRRRRRLASMGEDARRWQNIRTELDIYLLEGRSRTVGGPKVSECPLEQLLTEMAAVGALFETLDEYKQRMTELNQQANKLIDSYSDDDASNLSRTTSDLNTQWSKFNDNLRIRRAVLEAAARSRKDFQTALGDFEEWLNRMESSVFELNSESDNSQLVKDAHKRKLWLEKEKALRLEMEAHEDVLVSLRNMGSNLADSLDSTAADRRVLLGRLSTMNSAWQSMSEVHRQVRGRLESAQDEWEQLTTNLKELIYWSETQDKELTEQQPIGGDLKSVQNQVQFANNLLINLERKEPTVLETVKLSNSYLIQQDMRPKYLDPAIEEQIEDTDLIAKREAKRIAFQIKMESATLSEKFNALTEKAQMWKKIVDDAMLKVIEFDKAEKACDLSLLKAENVRRAWKPVKDTQLDDLPNQMSRAREFKRQLTNVRVYVDDVNDHFCRLVADSIKMSPEVASELESLNRRYKQLETAAAQRLTALENAMRDFGPASQHFLCDSVMPPWERAVSANRTPYFIDHDSEKTYWDHPKMAEIVSRLCDFNEVKFSAYRTGLKLRALQKRLCLDLVRLEEADAAWERLGLGECNERLVDVSEMVMALLPVYEAARHRHAELVRSQPLAIDLALNFLLNVYDPSRSGSMRVLSFKVAIVLLCCARLEDKYKYLFEQVSSSGTGVDQKKLALLLHDCIQIPKFLGEAAAFGGSNVEPSVRSCFQRVRFPHEVKLHDYLEWLKCEPQSLVWLPILHRVAAAETAKHQAKCNVCKMFPLVGLRYRCLKCFNFDMCQNCFFCQRTAKGHKITHPMQEYCVTTTSSQDMRDFGKVFRNKFRTKRHFRNHPHIGYLPVQSIDEGASLEVRNITPSNADTQRLHSRLELFAQRLSEAELGDDSADTAIEPEKLSAKEDRGGSVADDEHQAIATLSSSLQSTPADERPPGTLTNGFGTSTPQSPAQIVAQIDHAQKEELDAILGRLELENRQLQMEYDQLRGNSGGMQGAMSTPQLLMTNGSLGRRGGRPQPPFPTQASTSATTLPRRLPMAEAGVARTSDAYEADVVSEEDLLAEARALRQHKQRLEGRSRVLEEHNRQLEVQLSRLKRLIEEQQLPELMNGSLMSQQSSNSYATPPISSANTTLQRSAIQLGAANAAAIDDSDVPRDQTAGRIENLMSTAQDLGKAMGNLVTAFTSDDEEEALSESDD